MNILITLCARGGSKGIPGKNIKPIAGKPLLAYSIEMAQKFAAKYSADIVLSTDSDEVKKVASIHNLYTGYNRPTETASDTAGKIDAIAHALNYMEKKHSTEYDFILDLDVTSPLRTFEDLEEAFLRLQQDSKALNIFSVSNASKNPYFNMVEIKDNGYYSQVKRIDNTISLSRQFAPEVFEMNASFYFYRKEFFDKGCKSAITDFSLIYLMNHVCFDIDESIDFEFMEYLLNSNKLNFNI